MDLYYYCSYDSSPVGFRIGRVDTLSQDIESTELSSEHIEPFIRKCFETGLVRSAFGKIPSEAATQKKYFLLKKKLVAKKAGCNYYMNVAVVENEWDKFCSLLQDNTDEVSLATAIMNSIEPSGESAFGYKVNTHKLSQVLKCGYVDVCNCSDMRMENVHQNDTFYTTLSTEDPDTDALKKSLGISQSDSTHKEITKESGKVFCFKKRECQNVEQDTNAGENSCNSWNSSCDGRSDCTDNNPTKTVRENKTKKTNQSSFSNFLSHGGIVLDKRFGEINKK